MRNKGFLGFVAVAVGLGLAAAACADTVIISAIHDPAGAETWEVRVRLWGDLGVNDGPDDVGLEDFIVDVAGTGGASVTGSTNESPQSWFKMAGDPCTPSGFSEIRNDGGTGGDPPGVGIVAQQPAMYDEPGNYDAMKACAVIQGIGVTGGTWTPPVGSDANGGPVSYDADTKIASGTYTGAGLLTVVTDPDLPSFTTLEDSGDGNWYGPSEDLTHTSITTVVLQQLTGVGNAGGETGYDKAEYAGGVNVIVQVGSYHMAVNSGTPAIPPAAAVTNVTLTVETGTEAVLECDQDLAVLNLDGTLDLNSPAAAEEYNALRIYPPADDDANRAAVEADLYDKIQNGDIYDSNLHANSAIGITDKFTDPHGDKHVLVRATRMGDADCDGTVDFDDLLALSDNWDKSGPDITWDMADFDGDNWVEFDDLLALSDNWDLPYPELEGFLEGWGVGAVPEPGTLALLAIGAVAVIRRRRRG